MYTKTVSYTHLDVYKRQVLTSIITRRKELAMLQSIGMTGKQLKKMLSFEGLYLSLIHI